MKRWVNWLALVIVFSVACGFLSNWQFNRRETKLASIALVKSNFEQPAVPMQELLENGKFDLPKNTWRTVQVSGTYLIDDLLLVRNRPNDGQPGFEELIPFQTETGEVIFVSRGWIPTGANHDSPDSVPLPESGVIALQARILSSEPKLSRTAPNGQIASINVSLAAKQLGITDYLPGAYLRMAEESPNASDITAMPAPSTEEGNNLSYALQWILFALMAASAFFWRLRRDQQEAKGIKPAPKRKTRSQLDEAFEDATTKVK